MTSEQARHGTAAAWLLRLLHAGCMPAACLLHGCYGTGWGIAEEREERDARQATAHRGGVGGFLEGWGGDSKTCGRNAGGRAVGGGKAK